VCGSSFPQRVWKSASWLLRICFQAQPTGVLSSSYGPRARAVVTKARRIIVSSNAEKRHIGHPLPSGLPASQIWKSPVSIRRRAASTPGAVGAQIRLIVWYWECGHQVEHDPPRWPSDEACAVVSFANPETDTTTGEKSIGYWNMAITGKIQMYGSTAVW